MSRKLKLLNDILFIYRRRYQHINQAQLQVTATNDFIAWFSAFESFTPQIQIHTFSKVQTVFSRTIWRSSFVSIPWKQRSRLKTFAKRQQLNIRKDNRNNLALPYPNVLKQYPLPFKSPMKFLRLYFLLFSSWPYCTSWVRDVV
jgi:hypothetical protein